MLQWNFSFFFERVLVTYYYIDIMIYHVFLYRCIRVAIEAITKIGLIPVKDFTRHISPVTIKTYPTTNLTLKSISESWSKRFITRSLSRLNKIGLRQLLKLHSRICYPMRPWIFLVVTSLNFGQWTPRHLLRQLIQYETSTILQNLKHVS